MVLLRNNLKKVHFSSFKCAHYKGKYVYPQPEIVFKL